MAIEPTPDTLLKLQTELNVVKAQMTDMQTKIHQRKLCELARLQRFTTDRAHRIRDQLFAAPSRHAAQIAAEEGLEPALLNAAMVRFVREMLCAAAKLRV